MVATAHGRRQGATATPTAEGAGGQHISDWLAFEDRDRVTVFTGKVEVGQGARTSLAQIVADELHIPIARIQLVMGDTARTPYDRGTFGSRTTATMGPQLRLAAAAARTALLDRAAARWQVPREQLRAAGGIITHTVSGRTVTFAALAAERPLDDHIDDGLPVYAPDRWTVAGTAAPRADGAAIVTGAHQYTVDLHQPGMLHGRVLRAPRQHASLTDLDDREAKALAGVTVIRDSDFVGVTAADPQQADQALALLRPTWSYQPQPDGRDLESYLRSHPDDRSPQGRPAAQVQETGNVERGLQAVGQRHRATYTTAFIAHAPLEPRAALARWWGDQVTVWTGTQRPFGVQEQLAAALAIPAGSVRVIVPDTGSAYGGKHTGEAAIEAARLARVAGAPVKVAWTRQEEFCHAYFRPAAVIDLDAALSSSGEILCWEATNWNAGPGALSSPYAIPNQRVAYQPVQSPLRQGSYRALAATANTFAREVHMDVLAAAAGMDPLAFRLRNLTDGRLRAVLDAAAARFGWLAAPGDGRRGFGLACGTEKGGYVACCAEVHIDGSTGQVAVTRVVEAYECGAIVNPGNLRNQIEGAVVQGLGGALYERIEFADGQVLNNRFSRYRVPRFADVPAIDVVLIDRPDRPSSGAGETPIIGIAPAIANAIYAATGLRLTALPLLPGGGLP